MPKRFDRNLIVIGGGSAGLVASLIAAAVRAKVSLVEKHLMGGDCLNTGCVPSKTLIKSAKVARLLKTSSRFGFNNISYNIDFKKIMDRIHATVQDLSRHDSVARFTGLGVECLQGAARLVGPHSVEVNGQTLSARHIIIATGAQPLVPDIPGLRDIPYLSSDNFWQLRVLPRRLLVLGGGPVGCELAQAMARLGSEVLLMERENSLLPHEDEDVSDCIKSIFENEGITVYCSCEALALQRDGSAFRVRCRRAGQECNVEFDQVLLALGRRASTAGFGLQELGVSLRDDQSIRVDAWMRSSVPSLLACGDVTGTFQFTHMASHQAWYATVNALFGSLRRFRVDYSVLPWATFTDPEVATVGLNERQARAQGIPHECTRLPIDAADRAHTDGETQGFLKVLTAPGKDRILGTTIVAEHAGELIMEYISAMKNRYGLNRILGTIHIYPTLSDINKLAAGAWKRAHAPKRLLGFIERYHRWRC